MKEQITYDICNKVDIRLGTVISVKKNEKARKPSLIVEVDFGKEIGIKHVIIQYSELENENFVKNDSKRCFYCRNELSENLINIAKQRGVDIIVDGTHLDDLGDYRPGIDAAKQYGVRSPLVEAELTKEDIRTLSKNMGLEVWDKPAQACLSSRIPYGTTVTVEALTRIAKAEHFLRSKGFKQIRVRHHDSIARIEVNPSDLGDFISEPLRSEINDEFKKIGYSYVTLDMEGFRSGSLNEILSDLAKKNN